MKTLSVDVQMMWTMTIGSKCGMIGYMMPSPHFYQRRQLIVWSASGSFV